LLLPSFFSTALSKSNSTSAASVTFSATGAGFGAGFGAAAGAGGGGGGAGGSQAAFGIRSLSHSQTASDGVQWPARQHWPDAFFQIKPVAGCVQ